MGNFARVRSASLASALPLFFSIATQLTFSLEELCSKKANSSMCITEPFLAVSCFGTKHLCSSRAWHLKTYLYNVSAPFVFFILILSSVFVVSHPDCQEEACCWFHPELFQTEALAAFGLSPLLRAEANNTKSNTVLPASSSLHWDQHHQTAVGWNTPRACRWMWYYCNFSLDALPVGDTACGMYMATIPSAGRDFLRARFPSCII